MLTTEQRFQGALLGLACGDALGTTHEFKPRGTFEPLTDLIGGGPFRLQPGQWTDDTSMALCLAESLLQQQGFDAADQMQRYVRWWQEGYFSSTGVCFDIGNATRTALQEYLSHGDPFAGSKHPLSAGNGSLMRLVPVVMYFYPHEDECIHYAGESSRTTHAAAECIDACRYMAALLWLIFQGRDKQALNHCSYQPATRKVASLMTTAWSGKSRDEIRGSGYVIDSLEAALWCFYHTDNYADAVLSAVNLGEDTDTTAAICGQLAGAYYGIDNIPAPWQQKIFIHDTILAMASQLASRVSYQS
ncbi:MAG: ADP-ribosylglycohydrolase [Oceanospirillaceae bacterium]|nr:ADP-ribosylglycohydrolase [Oceanospirillaceae bacterium]MBT14335.1 ADP-ribosylglycohydrolase [Oceanospirillaceae bacterium]|tara:strand:+ start:4953 stop:5861 length:909 start_codon:yes stop_codon:yes gene_type:complete